MGTYKTKAIHVLQANLLIFPHVLAYSGIINYIQELMGIFKHIDNPV